MLVFILFYGLDWVATVPPTVTLCREYFGDRGPVVFGWVFAAHQFGGSFVAFAAGVVHTWLGDYLVAFMAAGALCLIASGLILGLAPGKSRVASLESRVTVSRA
jgi:hypothetical protein